VGAAVESALVAMLGARLGYLGRRIDLVWVGIGRDIEVARRGGGTRVLAEHAMRLPGPWRVTLLGNPLVASWDLHRSTWSDEWADRRAGARGRSVRPSEDDDHFVVFRTAGGAMSSPAAGPAGDSMGRGGH